LNREIVACCWFVDDDVAVAVTVSGGVHNNISRGILSIHFCHHYHAIVIQQRPIRHS
jgi:hypothetical protein